jgi:Killing trait
MAQPITVGSEITDSVTQANTKVLGDAPVIAMGNLFQATTQALANAAHDAAKGQPQSQATAQAATPTGEATPCSLDTASTGVPTEDIVNSDNPVKGL